MGLITPDFSDVQDAVEAGDYSVRVVDAAPGQWESKTGGAPTMFINWTLETFNEANPKNNGRRIFHRTPINGKGAFRLQQFYAAAMKQPLKGEFDTENLLGKELLVTLVEGKDKEGQLTGYTEVKTCRAL